MLTVTFPQEAQKHPQMPPKPQTPNVSWGSLCGLFIQTHGAVSRKSRHSGGCSWPAWPAQARGRIPAFPAISDAPKCVLWDHRHPPPTKRASEGPPAPECHRQQQDTSETGRTLDPTQKEKLQSEGFGPARSRSNKATADPTTQTSPTWSP